MKKREKTWIDITIVVRDSGDDDARLLPNHIPTMDLFNVDHLAVLDRPSASELAKPFLEWACMTSAAKAVSLNIVGPKNGRLDIVSILDAVEPSIGPNSSLVLYRAFVSRSILDRLLEHWPILSRIMGESAYRELGRGNDGASLLCEVWLVPVETYGTTSVSGQCFWTVFEVGRGKCLARDERTLH